jgi:hypothetical protein
MVGTGSVSARRAPLACDRWVVAPHARQPGCAIDPAHRAQAPLDTPGLPSRRGPPWIGRTGCHVSQGEATARWLGQIWIRRCQNHGSTETDLMLRTRYELDAKKYNRFSDGHSLGVPD